MLNNESRRFEYFRENYHAKFRASLFALVAFVNLMWASTTPIGGVADEPAYAVYANVVASGQGFGDANIPNYLASLPALTCMAHKKEVTADCQRKSEWFSTSNEPVKISKDVMISGYPEPYFYIVGQPSRFLNGLHAMYGMRLVSTFLMLAMVGLMVLLWPKKNYALLAVGTIVAVTPMFTTFTTAVNPNGFEIACGLSLAGLLAGLLIDREAFEKMNFIWKSRVVAILLISLSLSVAKPLSYLYTVLIIAMPLCALIGSSLVKATKPRGFDKFVSKLESALLVGIVLFSCLVGYFSNSKYREVMELRGTESGVLSLGDSTRTVISNFASYAIEHFGWLGWRDHTSPLWVLIAWAAIYFGIVYLFVRNLTIWSKISILGFMVLTYLVIPIVSTKALGLLGGAGFQSRYTGALFVSLPLIVGAIYTIVLRKPILVPILDFRNFVVVIALMHFSTLFWSYSRFGIGFPLFEKTLWWDLKWVPDYWEVAIIFCVLYAASSFFVIGQYRKIQAIESS
jgi:hypothetical protein